MNQNDEPVKRTGMYQFTMWPLIWVQSKSKNAFKSQTEKEQDRHQVLVFGSLRYKLSLKHIKKTVRCEL